jgi:hypothetical protein
LENVSIVKRLRIAVAGIAALGLMGILTLSVGCAEDSTGPEAQTTTVVSPVADEATIQAKATLQEFFRAWAAKDVTAYKALLTEGRNVGSWTFEGLDHVEFGAIVAAPEQIEPYLRGGDRGVTSDDLRCFRASVTFYYKPGFAVGDAESGEELRCMWTLVRGADGKWLVHGWGY